MTQSQLNSKFENTSLPLIVLLEERNKEGIRLFQRRQFYWSLLDAHYICGHITLSERDSWKMPIVFES